LKFTKLRAIEFFLKHFRWTENSLEKLENLLRHRLWAVTSINLEQDVGPPCAPMNSYFIVKNSYQEGLALI
jgi:hypothetical protein